MSGSGNGSVLRILHLEDNPADAELVQETLRSEGVQFEAVRVFTQERFTNALKQQEFDLIISDFGMSGFDGLSALKIVREHSRDLPFILVSGTIGEKAAIDTLTGGATDYVLKDNLERLVPAVKRALRDREEIDRRRRAEEQIHEQAALLDEATDAIFVRNMEERIEYWNRGAERIYGWTADEAIGKRADELLYPRDSSEVNEARRLVMERGEWSGELRQVSKAGKSIIVFSHRTLMRDQSGSPRAVLHINSDITERKQLETQFLRTQRLESIGTLAGGIAHDLNNVLSPIIMAVQLLKMNAANNSSRSMLDTIENSAQRGAAMVRQILSFARGAEGQRAEIQVKHLISEQAKISRDTFPRSIQISSRASSDLWPVMGDSTQLYQILMNLCVNARDAMPRGGTLSIDAENLLVDEPFARLHLGASPGPHVAIIVRDTGSGIPPAILDRIFDPFFTTKETGKGTGLGLSTVLGIVKGHGGFLSVYSEEGHGSAFKIYLPACSSARATAASATASELPRGNGELIIVADDEANIRQVTQSVLERYGYKVMPANDGTEAIAYYASNSQQVKMVMTDMSMPFLDGSGTIRALQRLNPQLPILAVSGFQEHAKVAEVVDQATVKFLLKPFSAESLLKMVHEMITAKP